MVDALLAHMKSIGEFLQHTNNMAPDVKEKIAQNQLDLALAQAKSHQCFDCRAGDNFVRQL